MFYNFFPVLDGIDFPATFFQICDARFPVILNEPPSVSDRHSLSDTIAASTLKMNLSAVPTKSVIASRKSDGDIVPCLCILSNKIFSRARVAVFFNRPNIASDPFPRSSFFSLVSHFMSVHRFSKFDPF